MFGRALQSWLFAALVSVLLCAVAGPTFAQPAGARATPAPPPPGAGAKAPAPPPPGAGAKAPAPPPPGAGAKASQSTPPTPAAGAKASTPADALAKPPVSSSPAASPQNAGSAVSPSPGEEPAAGSSKPVPTAGSRAATAASTFAVRLRDLESRVDELKEQIRRSHTRLTLLSDTILSGGIGGARAEIVFRNNLSNAFRITSVMFVLDGAVQYKKEDPTGELSKTKEIPIFSGPVPPGDHTMQVVLGLRGHGYGIFSYLTAFKPTVKRTHSFTADEGRRARVEVVAWEKGGPTTPIEQRPALRFVKKSLDPNADPLGKE